jgi:chromosome segregation ATPase
LTDRLQELKVQKSTLDAQKQTSRQTMRTLERKINDLQGSLDSLSVDEADLTILKSQMQDTTNALQTAQGQFAKMAWDTKISEIEMKISRVDDELKDVQTELTSTSAQGEFRAKIDVLKADLAKRTQAQKLVISANAERFKKLVHSELTPESADSQINVLIRRKTEDLEEAERVLDGTTREISQLEAKLNTCKEQLRDKRREKNQAHSKVMGFCDEITEFPGLLEGFEADVVVSTSYFPFIAGLMKGDWRIYVTLEGFSSKPCILRTQCTVAHCVREHLMVKIYILSSTWYPCGMNHLNGSSTIKSRLLPTRKKKL